MLTQTGGSPFPVIVHSRKCLLSPNFKNKFIWDFFLKWNGTWASAQTCEMPTLYKMTWEQISSIITVYKCNHNFHFVPLVTEGQRDFFFFFALPHIWDVQVLDNNVIVKVKFLVCMIFFFLLFLLWYLCHKYNMKYFIENRQDTKFKVWTRSVFKFLLAAAILIMRSWIQLNGVSVRYIITCIPLQIDPLIAELGS